MVRACKNTVYIHFFTATVATGSSSSSKDHATPEKKSATEDEDGSISDSPTVRKQKSHTKDQIEKDRIEQTKETKAWFNKCRVTDKCNLYDKASGKAMIPVENLGHPEECIAARERKEVISESVYQSLKRKGVGRTDVVVLIWQEDLEEAGCTIADLPDKKCTIPFQTVCGDHTGGGIQRLHKENPEDDQYTHVPCEILLCSKTQENIRLAYNLGVQDNEIKAMTTGMTPWDIVVKVHNVYESIKKQNIGGKSQQQKQKKLYEEIFTQISDKYTLNTFGSLRVLGQKSGKLWQNIQRLFDTPVPKKLGKGQPKPVTPSVGHFFGMADIPEDKLIQWTDRFFKQVDPWNSLMFKKRCESYKKDQRIRTQIREFVNVKDEENNNFERWGDLVKKYPFFGDDTLIDKWVNMMEDKAKAQLNTHLKQTILNMVKAHKATTEASPSKPEAPNVRCFYTCVECCIIFMLYIA